MVWRRFATGINPGRKLISDEGEVSARTNQTNISKKNSIWQGLRVFCPLCGEDGLNIILFWA